MNAFLLNLLLAIAWTALTGVLSPANLLVGFGLGFVVMLFTHRVVSAKNYVIKLRQAIGLAGYFVWELILANLRLAYDVLTPPYLMRPGIVAIPLACETDTEITILANLISLTPGTLSLDISGDRRYLYLHAMYIDDPELVRQRIKTGFERRVLEVLR